MTGSNAFNIGGIVNPIEQVEQDALHFDTVGQFDILLYQSSIDGSRLVVATTKDYPDGEGPDPVLQLTGFSSDLNTSHYVQGITYAQNDQFVGATANQFGALLSREPGEHVSAFQLSQTIEESGYYYVSNTITVESHKTRVSVHFDTVDYGDLGGDLFVGARTRDIFVDHYQDFF